MKNSKTVSGLLDLSVVAFIVFIIMMMLFWGCKHEPIITPMSNDGSSSGNNDTSSYTENTCDPDSVYFANDILPLFISNCAKSGCHDASSHQEDVVLDSYANIMSTGEVQPGHPSEGKILDMITSNDPDKKMPPPPNMPLSQAQVNMITTWINQGALNNSCSGGCDTLNVTYSGTIVPLLQSKCLGCHNSTTTSGNLNMESHSGVQVVALNGRLMGSVNHDAGYTPMPFGGAKLQSCEIAELRIWIADGAPNN